MSAKVHRATIEAIEDLAPGTHALFLRLPDGDRLEFKAGQFVSFQLPISGETVVRAYSIASDPADGSRLEIVFDEVEGGPGSGYLDSRRCGNEIDFTGPWGTFVLGSPPPARLAFVALESAIAPIRPMVHAALASSTVEGIQLLHVASNDRALLYRAELERCAAADRRFTFEPRVEAGGDAALLELLRQRDLAADADRSRHFFLCGVGDIVLRMRDLLRGGGYERRAVHYEKW